jgi:hypothetical protein
MDTQEAQDRRAKLSERVRSATHIGMGVIYVGVAVLCIFGKYFGVQVDLISRPIAIALGVVIFIYGVWRIYRGFKKQN